MAIDKKAGLEDDGENRGVGRDPSKLGVGGLLKVGHKRMSPLQALRLRCIDCCAGSINEVRLCPAVACASWPFRLGSNPWIEVSAERKAEMRERGKKLAALKLGAVKHAKGPSPTEPPTAVDGQLDEPAPDGDVSRETGLVAEDPPAVGGVRRRRYDLEDGE